MSEFQACSGLKFGTLACSHKKEKQKSFINNDYLKFTDINNSKLKEKPLFPENLNFMENGRNLCKSESNGNIFG